MKPDLVAVLIELMAGAASAPECQAYAWLGANRRAPYMNPHVWWLSERHDNLKPPKEQHWQCGLPTAILPHALFSCVYAYATKQGIASVTPGGYEGQQLRFDGTDGYENALRSVAKAWRYRLKPAERLAVTAWEPPTPPEK